MPDAPIARARGVVLRTPLLPWAAFAGLAGGDRARVRARVRELCARDDVREALFLASPSLVESLPFWERAPASERGQKVERALVRYLARMAGRATPFGLFAGFSVGTVGARTRLELPARTTWRRHARLDGDHVHGLAEVLARAPAVRAAGRYRPASSLQLRGDEVRWAEGRRVGVGTSYAWMSAEASPPLRTVLACAGGAEGATRAELVRALCREDAALDADEAAGFVDLLADEQLLVPELVPAVTGGEPLAPLAHALRATGAPELAAPAAVLEEVAATLAALGEAAPGLPPQRWSALHARLADLPLAPDPARLFQVDLVKPAPGLSLAAAPIDELLDAVELLRAAGARDHDAPLAAFRDAFAARHGDEEVALADVLDEEDGLGFARDGASFEDPSPLLAGLPAPGEAAEASSPVSPRWQRFVLGVAERAWQGGLREVVVERSALAQLGGAAPPLPDSFAVMAQLAARDGAAVDAGEYLVHLRHAAGPSAARLLGRFCHASAELAGLVEELIAAEEAARPDALFVELAHLPEGRLANVVARPCLRGYELPWLGKSGAPADRQLPLADLRLSLRDGRLRLRSARLGREVIVRHTNALGFPARALGVYQLLGQLQHQGVAHHVAWDWGALVGARFLPRVRLGRVVLALATWRLSGDALAALLGDDEGARAAAAAALGLPRFVAVGDDEALLPVDLENPLCRDALRALVDARGELVVREPFPGGDALAVQAPDGAYVHELVLPCVRDAAAPAARPVPLAIRRAPDPWLALRVQVGPARGTRVLVDELAPLVDALAPATWSFVRARHPEPHLRLLVADASEDLVGRLAARLGAGRRLALAPYQLDEDRLGGAASAAAIVALWQADSQAVLAALAPVRDDAAALADVALVGALGLVDGFCAAGAIADAGAWLAGRRAELVRALAVVPAFEHALGQAHRRERARREALAHDSTARTPFAARDRQVERVAAAWREHAGALTRPVAALVADLLAAHVARCFGSSIRLHELVLVDSLARLEATRRARRRA